MSGAFGLAKTERICSKKLIETLFNSGAGKSLSAFPLRLVYMLIERDTSAGLMPPVQAQMMVSVPKRYFKRAVKRNRVKRQVREAYRKNKQLVLSQLLDTPDKAVAMAFIWMDGKLQDSAFVEQRMINLLARLGERLCE